MPGIWPLRFSCSSESSTLLWLRADCMQLRASSTRTRICRTYDTTHPLTHSLSMLSLNTSLSTMSLRQNQALCSDSHLPHLRHHTSTDTFTVNAVTPFSQHLTVNHVTAAESSTLLWLTSAAPTTPQHKKHRRQSRHSFHSKAVNLSHPVLTHSHSVSTHAHISLKIQKRDIREAGMSQVRLENGH